MRRRDRLDLDSYSIGGLPSANEIRAREARRKVDKQAHALESVANALASLGRQVNELEGRTAEIERILYRSYLIQEKQLLVLNQLLPESERHFSIGDRELKARQILGLTSFGPLTLPEIKSKYKERVKGVHPDLNGGSRTEEFIQLDEAYTYLLEIVKNKP